MDESGKEVKYPVEVTRSRRKTLSLQIRQGKLLLKVPLLTSDQEIIEFLNRHRRWISTHMRKAQEQMNSAREEGILTMDEIRELAEKARGYIPGRVAYYASRMGISWGRITIRNQRSRWGSCSSRGNLNFNCLLMLCPREVIDAVIVHELAHRLEMNHSQRFYEIVRRTYPDYDLWDRWLKDHGGSIMKRMTGIGG